MVLEKRYHLPGKLVHFFKALHQGTKEAVRADRSVSSNFDATTGAWQGEVLAPVLFNQFFATIIAAALLAHSSSSVRLLFDLDGPLVGSRKEMKIELGTGD